MQKLKNILFWFIGFFTRPSARIGLGVLVSGGFIAGIIAWQGFNMGMDATNEEQFCLACHTMRDNLLPELQKTVHWSNRTGVRARCPDCHVPHEFTDKVARKMQASREVFGHLIGTIGTREKFLEHRVVLAQREWARLTANDSRECRACHDYKDMDFDKMRPESQVAMRNAAARNQSCISCHKGIAHQLPDMEGMHNPAFDTLVSSAADLSPEVGKQYFVAVPMDIFRDEQMTEKIGALEIATTVTVVEKKKDALLIELDLWRKNKGYGRVWYSHFGLNITSAILNKEVSRDENLVQVKTAREDDLTGLEWQQVGTRAWVAEGGLIDSLEPVWSIASSSYSASCSVCHRQPEEAHFDTNTWPGLFGGMVGFTNLDADTSKLVLKYLQTHSSDFTQAPEHDATIQAARP